MTREEFGILAKGMKATYPQPWFLPDKDAFNVWYELLSDLDYKSCSMAIKAHIMTEKNPPSISDIRSKATPKDNTSEADVWDKVRRAIEDSSYHAEERFAELDEITKRSVGSPSQLQAWARDPQYNENVVQSNFLKIYRTNKARANQLNTLPENVKAFISGTNNNLLTAKEN